MFKPKPLQIESQLAAAAAALRASRGDGGPKSLQWQRRAERIRGLRPCETGTWKCPFYLTVGEGVREGRANEPFSIAC